MPDVNPSPRFLTIQAEAAQRVLGVRFPLHYSGAAHCFNGEYCAYTDGSIYGPGPSGDEWNPLTSKTDAWMLLDKLISIGWTVHISQSVDSVEVKISKADQSFTSSGGGGDLGRCIVLACLLVTGPFKEQPPK